MTPPGQERVRAALARFGDATADRDALLLGEAWLAMTSVLVPSLDVVRWRDELDELAGSCAMTTRNGVIAHLFQSGRLRGDRQGYSNWRNSRIDHVLGEGRGIPITLSVVAVEVARRVGVPLAGVGMPAHFLVGVADDNEWFADAFNGGRVLDRSGCRDLFRRITGGSATWRDEYLRPTPPVAIVVRMLNNLRAAFTRDGDLVRLGLVMRMRAMIVSSDPLEDTRRGQSIFN